MALRRKQHEPTGTAFVVRGVCAECGREDDIHVIADAVADVADPLTCPSCEEREFYRGTIEVVPNPLTGVDLGAAFR